LVFDTTNNKKGNKLENVGIWEAVMEFMKVVRWVWDWEGSVEEV